MGGSHLPVSHWMRFLAGLEEFGGFQRGFGDIRERSLDGGGREENGENKYNLKS